MKVLDGTGYLIVVVVICFAIMPASPGVAAEGDIKLPEPSLTSDVSIEQALSERRSLRTYREIPITLKDLSQLMWAAQGITDPERGYRTAPSGMASFPINVYAVVFRVAGMPQGAYLYDPEGHELTLITKGDLRDRFNRAPIPSGASSGAAPPTSAPPGTAPPRSAGPSGSSAPAAAETMTDPVDTAALMVIITGNIKKSSEPGYFLEAGHVAQNIALQCVSLDMGVVTTRGFDGEALKSLLRLSEWENPIYVLPAGKK